MKGELAPFTFFSGALTMGVGGESEQGIEPAIKHSDWLTSLSARFVTFPFFLLDLLYAERQTDYFV